MQCVMNTRPHRNPPVFEWALQGGEYEPDELSHQAKRCINVSTEAVPIYFVNTEASKPLKLLNNLKVQVLNNM